ncbi:GNAT family N-acetyltransferase [Consotaella aegiceratis]|uniref:GNAT family N-acetyltransferase n=1 Tax=Consotaella aegiceratis TaxID=3097961 RepID=UPI002F3ECFC4
MTCDLVWRGPFDNDELAALGADCFGARPAVRDQRAQMIEHSLGWVCARLSGSLVGFANVAWDGGEHAFLVDVMVALPHRRHGLATRIVAEATQRACAAGCTWLHVDFEPHLRDFYWNACGFRPTDAGLIALGEQPSATNGASP